MAKSNEVLDYCLANLKDTILVNSWGEYGIFYNPGRKLKRGVYVLTVKEKTVKMIRTQKNESL